MPKPIYLDVECEDCFGFGMILPNPDGELELCPNCRGAGRIAERFDTGGFNIFVAADALKNGWGFRTRRDCIEFIVQNYT